MSEISSAGIDEKKLKAAFLEEADELMQKLSASLLVLEGDGKDRELLNETFRLVHSLKSESALIGYHFFSRLAHGMEDVLDVVRRDEADLDKPLLDKLITAADVLSEMLSSISGGETDADFDIESLLSSLAVKGAPPSVHAPPSSAAAMGERRGVDFTDEEKKRLAEAKDRSEGFFRLGVKVDESEAMKLARAFLVFTNLELCSNVVKTVPPMTGELEADERYARTDFYLTMQGEETQLRAAAAVDQIEAVEVESLGYDVISPRPAPQAGPKREESHLRLSPEKTTIRVDTKKLDNLWNLIAELIQQKAHVSRIYDRMVDGVEPHAMREDLGETFDSLDKISVTMQQVMMQTRMIPIQVIFNKFPRLVRELSRKLKKSVELLVSGEDTEIDRGIVEALSDPLTHVIRNSIDHGIEFPEERARLGKPEKGRVRVSAYQQGRGIVIELEDDGRGIELEKVREKAIRIGVPGAADFDQERLLELIFLPGFSTRDEVTDLSGRGVGMDVVATRIRGDLKGDVTVNTVPGEGSLLTITLPLTLTIVHAMLVRAENLVYALPLSGVESTTKLLNTEIWMDGGRRMCAWMGEELPLYYLGAIKGKDLPKADEYIAVILTYGMDRACVVVDKLLEEEEIVVKPIDDLLNYKRLFTGVSVREDGTPIFILDASFVQRGTL